MVSTVRSEKELDELVSALGKCPVVAVDTETLDLGFPDVKLVGLSAAWGGRQAAYVPVGHRDGSQLPVELVVKKLKPVLEDKSKRLVFHNAKYDIEVLGLVGINVHENIFDTMIAAWLFDTEGSHGLKPLAKEYFQYAMTELEEIAPWERHSKTGDKVYRPDKVSIDMLARYAMDDALYTYKLWELFSGKLEKEGLSKVFYELEMPFVFCLVDMETNGVYVDGGLLEELGKWIQTRMGVVEKEVYGLRPNKEPFNLRSTVSLNKILFEEIGLVPVGEKGKSGYFSTKEENLELWKSQHPIVEKLLEYRQLVKLYSTYVEGVLVRISSDGRLRSRFNRVSTGRLSSSRPNLQNWPRAENDPFGVRVAVIAPDGKKLVVADYSQIELRVLAHVSKDPVMINALNSGADLHSQTAKLIFDLDCPVEEVKEKYKAERSIAKTVNFGVVYGAGPGSVAKNAGVSVEKGEEILKRHRESYPGVWNFIRWTQNKVLETGWIKTLTGRKRHLLDAFSDDLSVKSKAQRQAVNSIIQGSAADIMAIAMRNIRSSLISSGLYGGAKMVSQVHDELLFEVDEEIVGPVMELVKKEMENAVKLRVALVADVKSGSSWAEGK